MFKHTIPRGFLMQCLSSSSCAVAASQSHKRRAHSYPSSTGQASASPDSGLLQGRSVKKLKTDEGCKIHDQFEKSKSSELEKSHASKAKKNNSIEQKIDFLINVYKKKLSNYYQPDNSEICRKRMKELLNTWMVNPPFDKQELISLGGKKYIEKYCEFLLRRLFDEIMGNLSSNIFDAILESTSSDREYHKCGRSVFRRIVPILNGYIFEMLKDTFIEINLHRFKKKLKNYIQ